MFAPIVKLFKSLNTNSHPGEIAHAVAIGMVLGFMPKNNVLWYILFVCFLFIRINKAAFLLTGAAVSLIIPFADPLFDTVGYALLNMSFMQNFYKGLFDIPFVSFTRLNNTVVAGSLVVSLILYIPVYIIIRFLILLWRKYGVKACAQSKAFKILYKLPLAVKLKKLFSR